MKKNVQTRLKKIQALLEFAKSEGVNSRMLWRSADLGGWESASPSWRVVNGRMSFQFHWQGRIRSYWILTAGYAEWGARLLLRDDLNPVPEPFDIIWLAVAPDSDSDSTGFWQMVKRWLLQRFPGCQIVRASKRSDLARTLSSQFLRVHFRFRGEDCCLLAAGEAIGDEADKAIGQALIWLSSLAFQNTSNKLPHVYILIPEGNSNAISHRSRLLNRDRIRLEIWEYQKNSPSVEAFHKAAPPSPPEENKDFRWPALGKFHWSAQLEKVLNLAPSLIRRYPRFQDYDSLRLWGLEFAQAIGPNRERICFGVGGVRTELTEENFSSLQSLIEEILYFRRPDSPDTKHLYYRLQAERWLEALVLEDVERLFPEILPETAYSQIPVYLGKDSGRIDILAADHRGTLVVMELKVAPDPDLPVQALDYWGRVIQHNENGDFLRRGYFSETPLNRRLPKIYLVSPVFSFHDTTECIFRFFDPEIEGWKISINEDWRSGVNVLQRSRIK